MEQFWPIVASAAGIILTGLATWLTAYITGWLNTKIKDKKIAKYATDILNIVMTAVQSVAQTYVETLKKAGQFDETAQKAANDKALEIIKGQLTQELSEYITENFGDMDQYLRTLIESTIYQLKK